MHEITSVLIIVYGVLCKFRKSFPIFGRYKYSLKAVSIGEIVSAEGFCNTLNIQNFFICKYFSNIILLTCKALCFLSVAVRL